MSYNLSKKSSKRSACDLQFDGKFRRKSLWIVEICNFEEKLVKSNLTEKKIKMAERVQQDLELMITELEQMQRVGLLSAEETKMVIKKRKRFEYKMQKQTKIKEDILAYIQYECSLLDLIELRRDKIGYLHKKNEIDDAIAKRIHRLFKITEHRFGHVDEKVWITHLGKSKFHEN